MPLTQIALAVGNDDLRINIGAVIKPPSVDGARGTDLAAHYFAGHNVFRLITNQWVSGAS